MKSKHDETNAMHEVYSFLFASKIHCKTYVLYMYTYTGVRPGIMADTPYSDYLLWK
jgi:hypothetical protein